MLKGENAVLMIVDVQGKLAGLMHECELFFANIQKMIRSAQILDIPIIYTEQAPEKIGQTIQEITWLLGDLKPITKKSFSCCGSKEFMTALQATGRKQILLTGMEAHVCLYQTARDLIKLGYDVYMVADAISARSAASKHIALERNKSEGAVITTFEMTLCELMVTADHPKFREILGFMK